MANIWGNNVNSKRLYFGGGSKITKDGDCSHEIKRCLLLGKKAITNLHSILKNRDVTLPTKVHIVKAMVFPVVMYRCESWTIKKAECQRIWTLLLNCGVGEDSWESRGLQPVWDGSNQSILKEINPEYSGLLSWRRKLQPTPVLLPGKFHGWRSLVGCHLWGRTESNTTEAT